MCPEIRLVYGIFIQAVEDYKKLLKRRTTEYHAGNCGYCSIDEIEGFFNSKWCAYLLQLINCDLTGKDILRRAQSKYC